MHKVLKLALLDLQFHAKLQAHETSFLLYDDVVYKCHA